MLPRHEPRAPDTYLPDVLTDSIVPATPADVQALEKLTNVSIASPMDWSAHWRPTFAEPSKSA